MPRPTDRPNDASAPLPKYDQLREQIDLLPPGQSIPADNEGRLASDVSRITARKALNPAQAEMAVVAAN